MASGVLHRDVFVQQVGQELEANGQRRNRAENLCMPGLKTFCSKILGNTSWLWRLCTCRIEALEEWFLYNNSNKPIGSQAKNFLAKVC